MIITITKIDAGEVHEEVSPVMPINRVKVTTPLLYFYCQGSTRAVSIAEMLKYPKTLQNLDSH